MMVNKNNTESLCVVGLGYVGLPLALALAKHFATVIGFDVNKSKIDQIQNGQDPTDEGYDQDIVNSSLTVSSDISVCKNCSIFIVAVPTPVDDNRSPDLSVLESACKVIAPALSMGALVIFESTVYPGVTEEFCGPILEKHSGLVCGKDFFLGYSPERINPGDKEHTIEKIIKVVSGQDSVTLERVAALYSTVVEAGVFKAASIKVAEAAKVIENTQRDLNIALINELAIVFDLMGIKTTDVLAAAKTKWNFLPFSPGLVGGHCIGVDPYYLTAKASQLGYNPQVILAGRRINDGMGKFIADKTIKLLIQEKREIHKLKVAILGMTFKENVSDFRNSRVPDIVAELRTYGVEALLHDPMANPEHFYHEYGLELSAFDSLAALDVLILAVPHAWYFENNAERLRSAIKADSLVIDIKSKWPESLTTVGLKHWSL
jgi:UDP-N-acetyl-D-galactosamine dehydrogenase